ncbi:MAG: GerAB/ArcD/ProY family transporter [Ectobacillus sp.]
MHPLPKENRLVSPHFAFYLIHTMQIGVGILGFERYIAQPAGYDAWISIIVSGVSISVLLWIGYRILHRGQNDLVAIHHDLFGKWVGGALSLYFILYFTAFVITVLRTYLEVIQIWMFPEVNIWVLTVVFLLLAHSFVTGGFRVVTGLCVLSLLFTIPLLFLKYFPLKEAHFYNMLPVLNHSFKDILISAKKMTLNYLGFELIFIYYPFLKEPKKSEKWAQFGLLFSMSIYLFTALVSFAYFNQDQLKSTVWATLTLWKVVDFPFLQRFEYMGIAIWLFVILPNVCLSVWAASRVAKQLFAIPQRLALYPILLVVLAVSGLLMNREQIDRFNTAVSAIGFYTNYLYFPLLYVLQTFIYKVRKRKHA